MENGDANLTMVAQQTLPQYQVNDHANSDECRSQDPAVSAQDSLADQLTVILANRRKVVLFHTDAAQVAD
jgi:hypothetical protein